MVFKVNGIEYYHWQKWYSSHLEAVIIFFFPERANDVFYGHLPTEWHDSSSTQWWLSVSSLGEVRDIIYGEPRTLGCWVGTPKSHSPHWSGHHFHIHNSWGLILYNAASAHCSHCMFNHCPLVAWASGAPQRQSQVMGLFAGRLLSPWSLGQGNYLHGLQRLRQGGIFLCPLDLQALFCPLASGSPFHRTPVAVPLPWLAEGWRGLSSSGDWPGGVQHFLPTGNCFGGASTFAHFSCSTLGVVGSQRGPLMGTTSSTVTSLVGTLVKAGGACLETVKLVWSLRNPSSKATPSKIVSLEKETYHSIVSLYLRMDLSKRCGWPGVGRLAFSALYCKAWA